MYETKVKLGLVFKADLNKENIFCYTPRKSLGSHFSKLLGLAGCGQPVKILFEEHT